MSYEYLHRIWEEYESWIVTEDDSNRMWWTGGQSQDLVGDSGVNYNNGEKIIIVMP